jgi:hypothetical protein
MEQQSMALNRAQSLLGTFEKNINKFGGLSYLSEAFEILSELMESTENRYCNNKARNIIFTYKQSIRKKINYILSNQVGSSYDELDYWSKVAQEVIDFNFDNDHEFISLQEDLSENKENFKVKPLLTQKEIYELIKNLSASERKRLMEILGLKNKVNRQF